MSDTLPCGQPLILQAVTADAGITQTPGMYAAEHNSTVRQTPTDTPCPLCETPLNAATWTGRMARLAQVTVPGRTAVTVCEPVPPHLELLNCPTCKVQFTRPK